MTPINTICMSTRPPTWSFIPFFLWPEHKVVRLPAPSCSDTPESRFQLSVTDSDSLQSAGFREDVCLCAVRSPRASQTVSLEDPFDVICTTRYLGRFDTH